MYSKVDLFTRAWSRVVKYWRFSETFNPLSESAAPSIMDPKTATWPVKTHKEEADNPQIKPGISPKQVYRWSLQLTLSAPNETTVD